ncbi:LysR family transcriptional regulator [Saccharopolyspora sp. 5N102]|uniref:LysR family transcriptional regulator n=1 Tax=Saccharopolyspora sp. 5N102 TaxID=3375155 RepID=UPI003790D0A0
MSELWDETQRLTNPLISRNLVYFIALADELHFGRAAERLFVTQSALSQGIRSMERLLGAELFVRSRRGVRLTDSGKILLGEATCILRRSERIARTIREVAGGSSGRIRVLYSRSGVHLGQRRLVEEFRGEHPEVDVVTIAGWASHNVAELRSRKADVAFVRTPPGLPDIDCRVIGEEELVAVLPAGSPLAARDRVTREEFRAQPVVMWQRESGPEFYDRVVEQVWGHDVPEITSVEPDYANVIDAVCSGSGVAVLDRSLAESAAAGGAVCRPFAGRRPTGEISLAWLNSDNSPLVSRFVEFVAAEAGRHGLAEPVELSAALARQARNNRF